ncbi:MAG: GNAT family N-acetyltransferase [Nanoarchaeota archaeon]|nr:GNAT family N-acetyltransferase [Nanoarchaeota archaeon]
MENLKEKCLELAKSLPDWFTDVAIENMKIDFELNEIISEGDLDGFLVYNSNNGAIKIIWIAVKKEAQRKGIGTRLINKLIAKAKELGVKEIMVETLSPNQEYVPYNLTRAFYEKNGFKIRKIILPEKEGWDEMVLYVLKL